MCTHKQVTLVQRGRPLRGRSGRLGFKLVGSGRWLEEVQVSLLADWWGELSLEGISSSLGFPHPDSKDTQELSESA